jgi:hypothetical protein
MFISFSTDSALHFHDDCRCSRRVEVGQPLEDAVILDDEEIMVFTLLGMLSSGCWYRCCWWWRCWQWRRRGRPPWSVVGFLLRLRSSSSPPAARVSVFEVPVGSSGSLPRVSPSFHVSSTYRTKSIRNKIYDRSSFYCRVLQLGFW